MAGSNDEMQYTLTIRQRQEGNAIQTTRDDLIRLGNTQMQINQMQLEEKVRVMEHAFYDLDAAIKAETATVKKEGETQMEADARRATAMQTLRTIQADIEKARLGSEKAAAANRDLGKSGADLGRGLLAVSQGFEDAQYGIKGVLNNIPQAIMMFGGSAGLAGGVSIAAVTLDIFWDKVQKATEAAKVAANTAKEYADKLVELSKTKAHEAMDLLGISAKAAEERIHNLAQAEIEHIDVAREMEDINRRVAASNDALAMSQLKYAQQVLGINTTEQQRALKLQGDQEEAQAKIDAETDKVKKATLAYEELQRQYQATSDERDAAQATRDKAIEEQSPLKSRSAFYGDSPQFRDQKADVDAKIAALQEQIDASTKTIQEAPEKLSKIVTEAQTAADTLDGTIKVTTAQIDAINQEMANKVSDQALTESLARNRAVATELTAAMDAFTAATPLQAQAAAYIKQAASDGVISAQEMQGVSQALGVLYGRLNDSIQHSNGQVADLITLVTNLTIEQRAQSSRIQALMNNQGIR